MRRRRAEEAALMLEAEQWLKLTSAPGKHADGGCSAPHVQPRLYQTELPDLHDVGGFIGVLVFKDRISLIYDCLINWPGLFRF